MQSRNFTYEEVADWILANRYGNAFSGWTKDNIVAALVKASADNATALTLDGTGNAILGVILCEKQPNRVLHVKHVLTIKPKVLQKFLEFYHEYFEGYEITAYRHNDFVAYDKSTPRLVKLLETA